MDRLKVLVTGGGGYIANSLFKSLANKYEVSVVGRQDFDLTAFEAVNKFFQGKYFDVVIHCAVQGGNRLRQETFGDMDVNLAAYYNLLQHRPHYYKLIHFGSGAEFTSPQSPYGLSKAVISKSMSQIENFFNIRIYAVFDENELDRRFIKSCIKNYIHHQPMLIHENKRMTFFYMQDLITLVQHYIDAPSKNLNKEVDCSYEHNHTLLEVAQMINNLSEHKVEIEVVKHEQIPYIGVYNLPNIELVGLQQGIQEVYNKLKNGN